MDIKEDKKNNCVLYVDDNGSEYMLFDRDNKKVTTKEWIINFLQSLPKTSHNTDYDFGSKKAPQPKGKICPICKETYNYGDMHFGYCTEKGQYCRTTGKSSHNQ